MTKDQATQALEILMKGDGEAALDMLKEIIAGGASDSDAEPEENAESAGDQADPSNDDGSEGDGAEGIADPNKKKNQAIDPRVVESRLTPRQLEICREQGIDPKDFLRVKASMNPSVKSLQRSNVAAQPGGAGDPMVVPGAFARPDDPASGGTSNGGYRRT